MDTSVALNSCTVGGRVGMLGPVPWIPAWRAESLEWRSAGACLSLFKMFKIFVQNLHLMPQIQIDFMDATIYGSHTVKNLGVVFHQNIAFLAHVDDVV